jgi:hypothetical protein
MTAPFLLDEMSEESACLAGRSTYVARDRRSRFAAGVSRAPDLERRYDEAGDYRGRALISINSVSGPDLPRDG